MPYKLTKKYPLPKNKRNSYPFRSMGIGDSFLIPYSDANGIRNIRSAASHFHRRTGLAKFTIAVEDKGLRVFRVS